MFDYPDTAPDPTACAASTGDLCYQISSTEVADSELNDPFCSEDCDPPAGCTMSMEIAACTTTCDGADAAASALGSDTSVTCAGAKAHVVGAAALAAAAAFASLW
jgi:hypothetical protein